MEAAPRKRATSAGRQVTSNEPAPRAPARKSRPARSRTTGSAAAEQVTGGVNKAGAAERADDAAPAAATEADALQVVATELGARGVEPVRQPADSPDDAPVSDAIADAGQADDSPATREAPDTSREDAGRVAPASSSAASQVDDDVAADGAQSSRAPAIADLSNNDRGIAARQPAGHEPEATETSVDLVPTADTASDAVSSETSESAPDDSVSAPTSRIAGHDGLAGAVDDAPESGAAGDRDDVDARVSFEPAAAETMSDVVSGDRGASIAGDVGTGGSLDGSAAEPAAEAQALPATPEPERTTFIDLGLSEPVLRAIADMGYRHPTPIQEQAIPQVLMTRDVLGVAQTGTGKTASFTLPMLDILAGSRARARMPRSLILEPTRELALQVAENFVQYGKYLKLTHALIIGGESMSDQKEVLMRGVDVLIATPGRLIDMFDRGSILLTDTRILVIDEADRMLDMGFIPDVERIVSMLPRTRQTLFFSATMGPEIRRLADAFLQNPKEITVSRPASVATTITEGLALVAEHDKREALRRLIRTQKVQNALIFCNRKRDVDILYKSLTRHRFSAGALHGDMAQTVRFTTLEKFKANELQLLVCSDVAARGLDIGGLSHVFNFDVPHHPEDYVHRIGRTGRAGLEGHAFTIASPTDRYAVSAIEKLIGHPIPPLIVEGLDPVDWAEEDGRKRRGKPLPKRKPDARPGNARPADPKPFEQRPVEAHVAAATVNARTADNRAPDPQGDVRSPRPGRDRPGERNRDRDRRPSRPPSNRPAEPALEVATTVPMREAPPRRDEQQRRDARRDEPRRDDGPRGRRDNNRDQRRDDRRDRGRRDEDLGPAVRGFGDEVPAFMLLRVRTPRPMQEETEV